MLDEDHSGVVFLMLDHGGVFPTKKIEYPDSNYAWQLSAGEKWKPCNFCDVKEVATDAQRSRGQGMRRTLRKHFQLYIARMHISTAMCAVK